MSIQLTIYTSSWVAREHLGYLELSMDTDHTAVSSGSLALKALSFKSLDLQNN